MWNFKTEKLALAALIAAFWPVVLAPPELRAKAEELHSAMPGSGTAAPSNSTNHQSDSSPCVLLRNDNVLFGTARQVGEFVIVETGHGGEIKLARQEVLCWSNSLRNLYRYRIDHRQQRDLSAMVRDARWCMRYDLYDLAAQQIREIRLVDPRNVDARLIEDQLRRRVAAESTSPALETASIDATIEPESVSLEVVGYEDPGDDTGMVDVRALRRFASHVQPMLVNRCGRCHDAANHDSTGWTLVLPSAGSRASSRMTRDNLTSTLRYVNSELSDQSELLAKATSAHGGQEAPLDARSAKAIDSLRIWLWMAAASMIQPSAGDAPGIADVALNSNVPPPVGPLDAPSGGEPLDHGTAASRVKAEAPSSGPSRLPQVANPFDPDLFNRRFHSDSSNTE